MQCPKCGSTVPEGMTFCLKCGQPVAQTDSSKSPNMPKAPTAPKAPSMPTMPKAPNIPQAPHAPQAPTAPKGSFTNAVRSVANAITGGAMNRDIAHEQQQAVNMQQRVDQGEIHDAQQAALDAEQARQRAEREAERQHDVRSMEALGGAVDVVRGRAIWAIQPGEIARRISERELEEVEKLKGIIVQEGCTAIIFANGELVSTLSAGAYLFYKSVEEEQQALRDAIAKAEKEMAEQERRQRDMQRQTGPTFRELGIVGEIGQGFSWLGRIIFGEKKGEKKDKVQKRQLDYARILARLTQVPVLSVYIVSNRVITMTFGSSIAPTGELSFAPYTIPVGIHNVEIGVSLQMQIDDIHAFATNYLADRNSVTVAQIQQMLNSPVETLLRQALRNADYEQSGLAPALVEQLKQQIRQTISQQVFGISCTQVLSITDSDKDFERFRSVERELYCTERELDYLHRTGEFRNRMETETNSQQVLTAQNEEQLRYALQQVNKDQLLHDDELEEYLAQLENSKVPRNEAIQMLHLESEQRLADARQKAEWALDDSRTQHDWEREDLARRRNWGIEDQERERQWLQEEREYDRQRGRMKAEADYDFEQMMRQRNLDLEDHARQRQEAIEDEQRQRANRLADEQTAYERERQQMFDRDQIAANESQRQMQNLETAMRLQMMQEAQEQQHAQAMATIKSNEQMNRDNQFANMTAEQIRAAQLSHLSSDAQVAMAGAYGNEKEAEMLRQQQQRDDANRNADMDRMERMFNQMGQNMMGMSQNMMAQQQQRADEYRDDARRQQQRLDHTQDVAMQNVAQVSTAAANSLHGMPTQQQPAAQPAPEMIECQCYNCQHTIRIPQGAPKCPDCGAPFQW